MTRRQVNGFLDDVLATLELLPHGPVFGSDAYYISSRGCILYIAQIAEGSCQPKASSEKIVYEGQLLPDLADLGNTKIGNR